MISGSESTVLTTDVIQIYGTAKAGLQEIKYSWLSTVEGSLSPILALSNAVFLVCIWPITQVTLQEHAATLVSWSRSQLHNR
jgi:hypothetical protein